MAEHWRVGLVERSVLEALDRMGAVPDRHHIKCSRTVERLGRDFGVSPRYGYESLCALAQPWLQNIPLVDFHGNLGSPDPRDGPAAPRYTEARLSRAGVPALAAELGAGPKVPVALVNGNLHVDGGAPPFSPRRVIDTVLALADDRGLRDDEIVDRVGAPESPTGCGMACDLGALWSGAATTLTMSARSERAEGERGPVIVLSRLPLGIGADTVVGAIAARVDGHARRDPDWDPSDFDELALPLRDVRNASYGQVERIVCEPRKNVALEQIEPQILATWGVTIRVRVQLPAPLAVLVRELADEDPTALRAALDRLAPNRPHPS